MRSLLHIYILSLAFLVSVNIRLAYCSPSCKTSSHGGAPYCPRIGGIFPMFVKNTNTSSPIAFIPDHVGIQYLQAYKMAIDDINNGS